MHVSVGHEHGAPLLLLCQVALCTRRYPPHPQWVAGVEITAEHY